MDLGRRVDEADFDLEAVPCGLVGLRRNFSHATGGLHLRVVGEERPQPGDLEESFVTVPRGRRRQRRVRPDARPARPSARGGPLLPGTTPTEVTTQGRSADKVV